MLLLIATWALPEKVSHRTCFLLDLFSLYDGLKSGILHLYVVSCRQLLSVVVSCRQTASKIPFQQLKYKNTKQKVYPFPCSYQHDTG